MAEEKTKDEQIKQLQEENDKLNNNLNMLKMYFRDYDILNHYVAWIKYKAGEGKKPELLTLKK